MKRLIRIILILWTFFLFSFETGIQNGNENIKSFSKAKKFLHKVIYSETLSRKTFYCGCLYDHNLVVNSEICGYIPEKKSKRAKKIEWEHIVPTSVFGKELKEWKEGHPDCVNSKGRRFKGRKCASKMNRKFQIMQADMFNLVPAVGEINNLRADFSFGEIPGEKREFGKCDFEIQNRIAEPADHIKGNIARIYSYMNAAYPGFNIINEKNRSIFEQWSKLDPVDKDECDHYLKIEKIQGNQNLVLRKLCLEKPNTVKK